MFGHNTEGMTPKRKTSVSETIEWKNRYDRLAHRKRVGYTTEVHVALAQNFH